MKKKKNTQKEKKDGSAKLMNIGVICVLGGMIVLLCIIGGIILTTTALSLSGKLPQQAPDLSTNFILITLACISFCIALSICVPYVMAKMTNDADVRSIVEELTIVEIKKTQNRFEKVDADHSRITAVMLNSLNKPIWAIGWSTRSMIRYLRCDGIEQNDMSQKLCDTCIPTLIHSIDIFMKKLEKDIKLYAIDEKALRVKAFDVFNQDAPDEPKDYLIQRTLTDLIDYRIESQEEKKNEYKDAPIYIEELDSQADVITSFIKFLIKTLGERNVKYCYKSSWNGHDKFKEYLTVYTQGTDKSMIELYNKLKTDMHTAELEDENRNV